MAKKMEQKSGDDSQNIQVAGDLNIGISATEARQLAIDVFKANLYDFSEKAAKVALERAEEIDGNQSKTYSQFINDYREVNENIIPLSNNSINKFWYKAGTVDFIGRTKEKEKLQAFCDNDILVSWWAITGDGGSGKSRLAYEFVLANTDITDWTMKFIAWEELQKYTSENFSPWQHEKHLLVVVDYVVAHADQIGLWVQKLLQYSSKRKHKIRVLLLEREGISENDKTKELQYPQWYNRLINATNKDISVEANLHESSFLALTSLSECDLKLIIKSYLEKQNIVFSDSNLELIVEQLKTIDPKIQRPIYVLFLADAWIQKATGIEHWDRNALQQWINKNEIKKIELLFSNDKEAQKAAKYLLAFATAVGQIDLGNLPASIKSHAILLNNYCRENNTCLKQTLSAMGSIQIGNDLILKALVPDLMGEYFSLVFLKEFLSDLDSSPLDNFIETAWVNFSHSYAFFLSRLIEDYLDDSFVVDILLAKPPSNEFNPNKLHAELMLNLSSVQSEEAAFSTIAYLKTISKKHPNISGFATLYSMGLFNLSLKQSDASQSVKELKKISEEYSDNQNIILNYAMGLVNLAYVQTETEAIKSINELKKLSEKYSDNQLIIMEYSKGLANFANNQSKENFNYTFEAFKVLHKKHFNNARIMTFYASGLFNLSTKQAAADSRRTIELIKDILDKYPDNQLIAVEYSKGVFNLSLMKPDEFGKQSIAALKSISEKHPDNQEIVVMYAKGLFTLSLKQSGEDAKLSVNALNDLYDKYLDNLEIAIRYAKGVFSLSTKQIGVDLELSINELKRISEKHSKNQEIAIQYAQGLYNIALKQSEVYAKQSIKALISLTKEHPDNQVIAKHYAKGLYNLSNNQGEIDAKLSIDTLGNLADKYFNIEEIVIDYANGLFNLSNQQVDGSASKTISLLKSLSDKHPYNQKIALEYSKGLYNLSVKNSSVYGGQCIMELERMAEKYSDNQEVVMIYAKGLYYFSLKYTVEKANQSINILKRLKKEHHNNQEIVLWCTKGLLNLTRR